MGFEPTIFSVTGRRRLQTLPQAHNFYLIFYFMPVAGFEPADDMAYDAIALTTELYRHWNKLTSAASFTRSYALSGEKGYIIIITMEVLRRLAPRNDMRK